MGPGEEVDGELCQVVTFWQPPHANPSRAPAWFAWWIGLASGELRRDVDRNYLRFVAEAAPDLAARRIGVQADIPAIYSWGVAYKGIENALIDVDLRYFDCANAALFGRRVRDGGLGWNGVLAVAVGGQYRLSERLTLRGGYLYNPNPIPEPVSAS